jgi:hypothetical protein
MFSTKNEKAPENVSFTLKNLSVQNQIIEQILRYENMQLERGSKL